MTTQDFPLATTLNAFVVWTNQGGQVANLTTFVPYTDADALAGCTVAARSSSIAPVATVVIPDFVSLSDYLGLVFTYAGMTPVLTDLIASGVRALPIGTLTPDSTGGISGPNQVTLTFVDADSIPVPNVLFTVKSGSSVISTQISNNSGVASFGLVNGSFTVIPSVTGSVAFSPAALTVIGTTTLTITGTSNPLDYGSLTMAMLRADTLTALGAESIDVEISTQTLNLAIADAIRMLNQWHPPVGWGVINFTSSMPLYTIAIPGLYGILEVDCVKNWFGTANNTGLGLSPFLYYPGFMFAYSPFGMAGDTAGDFDMEMTYQKSSRIIFGRDFDWNARLVSIGTVQLFVRAGAGSQVQFQYVWHITADDDPQTGVSFIPSSDVDWVRYFIIARAKQVLGRILRKYGNGVNMPDGGSESLDGSALVSEGKEEQKELEQKIRKRRRPLSPQRG